MTFSSLLFDCASFSWKYHFGRSIFGGRTEIKNHTCLSPSVGLRFKWRYEVSDEAFAQLETVSHKSWRKKKKPQRCDNYLLTAHLWSSTSGEVPVSPIDLKSQYLHPLKCLAYSLRGLSTEFHSSTGPSQWSRFITAIWNLKMGTGRFHLDSNAVQKQRCAAQMLFPFFFPDTKISPDVTSWLKKHHFLLPMRHPEIQMFVSVTWNWFDLPCVQVTCKDLSTHCWFWSGKKKTLQFSVSVQTMW